MGTGVSRNKEGELDGDDRAGERLDQDGGQLYVSLKMENYKVKADLIPHVYGSVPPIGSWDCSKAVSSYLTIRPFVSFSFRDCLLICLFIFEVHSFLWNGNLLLCGN